MTPVALVAQAPEAVDDIDDDQTLPYYGNSPPLSELSFDEEGFGYNTDMTEIYHHPAASDHLSLPNYLSNAFTQHDSEDSAVTANSSSTIHDYLLLD